MDYLKLIPIAAMVYAIFLACLSYFVSFDTVDSLMNPIGVIIVYVLLLLIKIVIDKQKKKIKE